MKTACIFLLACVLTVGNFSWGSFEENSRRYLSSQEIIWTLMQYFEIADEASNANCRGITELNGSVAGVNSPLTGEPVSPTPGQGTVVWISGCVSRALSSTAIAARNSAKLKTLIGDQAFQKLQIHGGVEAGLNAEWKTWNDQERRDLIAHVVSTLLGPDEVILDFGFIQDVDVFRDHLLQFSNQKPSASVLDTIRLIAVNLVIRDEFLSY